MSKMKIEHGASRINLVLLKTNIEDTVAQDIDLLAEWSDNDRKYIVNELLRFALTQEEDFQKYKVSLTANPTKTSSSVKPGSSPAKAGPDTMPKADQPTTVHA